MSRWRPERVVERLECGESAAEPAFDALDARLAARGPARGARLTCVVSDDAVRYAMVPWVESLRSDDERDLLARQCFAESLGDDVRDWVVSRDRGRYGRAALAAAVEASLLERLDAIAAARGLAVASVRPSLVHAFERHRRRDAQARTWLVRVERHGIAALLLERGEPVHARQAPVALDALPTLLAREGFTLGIDEPGGTVIVDGAGRDARVEESLARAGWSVTFAADDPPAATLAPRPVAEATP